MKSLLTTSNRNTCQNFGIHRIPSDGNHHFPFTKVEKMDFFCSYSTSLVLGQFPFLVRRFPRFISHTWLRMRQHESLKWGDLHFSVKISRNYFFHYKILLTAYEYRRYKLNNTCIFDWFFGISIVRLEKVQRATTRFCTNDYWWLVVNRHVHARKEVLCTLVERRKKSRLIFMNKV